MPLTSERAPANSTLTIRLEGANSNTLTVSAVIFLHATNTQIGSSIEMLYVPTSDGDYEGIVPHNVLGAGKYDVIITATSTAGAQRTWTILLEIG